MADCSQSPYEFFQDAFSPQVAVLCSHDAEVLCRKNNLSFVELTQPFCRLSAEAVVRDPSNVAHTVRNLRLNMKDINSGPPQPTLARKLLNEAVANALPDSFELNKCEVMTFGNYDLQLSATCPWFEAYRECFLQVIFPSDHEFLKHHLACIFVVSSSHADVMDQFNKLTQQQHQQQHQQPNKLPKWFCPNIMRYYVLIHDVACADLKKAESVYQTMKSTYGMNNCHLLQTNSRIPGSETDSLDAQNLPDPWSKFLPPVKRQDDFEEMTSLKTVAIEEATEANELTSLQSTDTTELDHPLADGINHTDTQTHNDLQSDVDSQNLPSQSASDKLSSAVTSQRGGCLTLTDHDRLRIFVHEFLVRGLIPWAERTLRILNDQVSTKKGLGRSFLSSAIKRFTANKPLPQGNSIDKPNVVYTTEAPEMQLRRLADLAMMFQLYELSYHTYHQCKRDFNNDHAWLHFAGATEMAAVSVFMQGSAGQRQYPLHYMETAVSTYQATCRLPNYATRTTLFNCEALKSRRLYQEAAVHFIKMTSEDSDLRSSLLLEQAAHCYLNMRMPMPRKYAFHMILAGHRFSKAGQRRHALRAYSQALQTYKGKDWSLAEDHINFTIGRQSFNLKQLENASLAFKHLMSRDSRQAPPQQNAFLREYIFVFKQLEAQRGDCRTELPQLPLPLVEGNATKVLCAHPHSAKEGCVSASSCALPASPASEERAMNACVSKLEQLVLVARYQSLPPTQRHNAVQCFSNVTLNTEHPLAVIQESIVFEVHLVNPMKVALVLSNVALLWRFLPVHYADEDSLPHSVSNEIPISKNPLPRPEDIVQTQAINELVLQGGEHRKVLLTLRPMCTGELHVTGLAYNLAASSTATAAVSDGQSVASMQGVSVRGKLNLECQGPRLNKTKAHRASRMYDIDRRLDVHVVPAMPRLEVHFSNFPESLLQGEIRRVLVYFTNCGATPLKNLRIACTNPEIYTLVPCATAKTVQEETTSSEPRQYSTRSHITKPEVKFVEAVSLDNDCLMPGQSQAVVMWICAASAASSSSVFDGSSTASSHGSSTSLYQLSRVTDAQFLFYYEPVERHPRSRMQHRVLHHAVQLQIRPSIQLRAMAKSRSTSSSAVRTPRHDVTSDETSSSNSAHISMVVQNVNNETTLESFSITQVCAISTNWRLNPLQTALHSIDIHKGESSLLSFAASKGDPCVPSYGSRHSALLSIIHYSSKCADLLPPCCDLYYRSQHPVTFADVEVEPPKPAMLPEERIAAPSVESLLQNISKIDISLLVIWQASWRDVTNGANGLVEGHSHVTLTDFGKVMYNPPLQLKQLEQPPVQFLTRTAAQAPPQDVTSPVQFLTRTAAQALPQDVTSPVQFLTRTAAQAPPQDVTSSAVLSSGAGAGDTLTSQMLRYRLHYNDHVQHDFSRQRLCRVTIRIECRNLSAVDLRLDIDTGQADRCRSDAAPSGGSNEGKAAAATAESTTALLAAASLPTALHTASSTQSQGQSSTTSVPLTRHVAGSFVWTNRQLASLSVPSQQSTTFTLQATFNRPGVYNLTSSLCIKALPLTQQQVFGSATEAFVQTAPSPCLIRIG